LDLEENIFENFNIFENNIISVELAKVLLPIPIPILVGIVQKLILTQY
jgi:hypothetical protein